MDEAAINASQLAKSVFARGNRKSQNNIETRAARKDDQTD